MFVGWYGSQRRQVSHPRFTWAVVEGSCATCMCCTCVLTRMCGYTRMQRRHVESLWSQIRHEEANTVHAYTCIYILACIQTMDAHRKLMATGAERKIETAVHTCNVHIYTLKASRRKALSTRGRMQCISRYIHTYRCTSKGYGSRHGS